MYNKFLKLQNVNNLIVCDDQPRQNMTFCLEMNEIDYPSTQNYQCSTYFNVIVLKMVVLSFQFSFQLPIFFNANCFSTRPRAPFVNGPKGLCYEFCSEFVVVFIAWPTSISEACHEMGQSLPPDYLHWANAMADCPYYFIYH